jgi:hypothetical protein
MVIDPNLMAPLIAILCLAAFAATIYSVQSKKEKIRMEALEGVSKITGCTFSAKDTYGLVQQLKDFDLFHRERSRFFRNGKVTNVLRGMVGETEVFLFDYTYVVSTGKSAHRVVQTVFFANDKKWFLPNFQLKPENWWHKLISAMGLGKEIDFEENKEFSDKFWLKSEFEDLIRKQFTPELQQFMLEKPPVHLEGNNYYLLAYKPGTRIPSGSLHTFFDNCCALTRLLQSEGKTALLELVELKPETVVKVENKLGS